MTRIVKSFKVDDSVTLKEKILLWSKSFKTSIYLDSNEYKNRNGDIESILAAGVIDKIPFTTENSFKKLDDFISKVNDWIFGFLSYELKNEIEDLQSKNNTTFNIPNLFFF